MKTRLFLIIFILLPVRVLWADEPNGFPIIADILHTELYDATRFRDIHKAGFNACLCRCQTNEDNNGVMLVSQVLGILVLKFHD